MFHLITGSLQYYDGLSYIVTPHYGIQVNYTGKQPQGTYFLHPHIDDNLKTIHYYARDTALAKKTFEQVLKISWIWPKTAFHIANLDIKDLQGAIESMNVSFFQKVPGVGPKTAKRLIIELKSALKPEELTSIWGDAKIIKTIVSHFKTLWYDSDHIRNTLSSYPYPLTKDSLNDAVKWLVGKI